MSKGTPSFGKRNSYKTHIPCRRCGKKSFHTRRKECSSCGYWKFSKIRKYSWAKIKV